MRKFNSREKEFITQLSKLPFEKVDTFGCFLQKNYFTKESQNALIIKKNENALLYVSKEIFSDFNFRRNKIGHLFEILTLIEYLEDNRYINILKTGVEAEIYALHETFTTISVTPNKIILNSEGDYLNPNDVLYISSNKNEILFEAMNLPNINLVSKYLNGVIFVTEELHCLVKNNFIDDETRRHNGQQVSAIIGIIISIILGLYAIYSQVVTTNEQRSESVIENKIQEERFQKIESNINETNSILKRIETQRNLNLTK